MKGGEWRVEGGWRWIEPTSEASTLFGGGSRGFRSGFRFVLRGAGRREEGGGLRVEGSGWIESGELRDVGRRMAECSLKVCSLGVRVESRVSNLGFRNRFSGPQTQFRVSGLPCILYLAEEVSRLEGFVQRPVREECPHLV